MQTLPMLRDEVAEAAELLISVHKTQRRDLSTLLTTAGGVDWFDPDACDGFVQRWTDLRCSLRHHTEYERTLFASLRQYGCPASQRVTAAHDDVQARLALIDELVATASSSPSVRIGEWLHRELSGFIAGYFVHLLDEELIVIPALLRRLTDSG